MSKKVRCYHVTREVYDKTRNQKHTILVYGELVQTNEAKGFVIAPVTYIKSNNDIRNIDDKYVILNRNDKRPVRIFNFGWAICDLSDEFDLATGIKLAKRRFSNSPMVTTDVRFFSDEMIKAILESELNFMEEHLEEKFLPDDYQNGCNGECETCQRDDCDSKGSIEPEVKTHDEIKECETEELPTFSKSVTNETEPDLSEGAFIKYRDGYKNVKRYGLVKSVEKRDKRNIVSLYWKVTRFENGWSVVTNEKFELDEDIEFLPTSEIEKEFIIKSIIGETLDLTWDDKNRRFKL